MKVCKYCGEKISWYRFGRDHEACTEAASDYRNVVIEYTRQSILEGTFDLKSLPSAVADAEKYLPASDMEYALAYGYDDAVEEMCEDALFDNSEMDRVNQFVEHFAEQTNQNFNEVFDWLDIFGTRKTMFQARQLHQLKSGELIPVDPPTGLMIGKGEKFIYAWPSVTCYSLNVKTRYKGSSTGGSYRLTGRFSIRHSQHRGRPVSYSEWKQVGSGLLAITNKNLIFSGEGSTPDRRESLSKIISVDPADDGFIVNTNLKTRPALRISMDKDDAWYASNMLVMAQSV